MILYALVIGVALVLAIFVAIFISVCLMMILNVLLGTLLSALIGGLLNMLLGRSEQGRNAAIIGNVKLVIMTAFVAALTCLGMLAVYSGMEDARLTAGPASEYPGQQTMLWQGTRISEIVAIVFAIISGLFSFHASTDIIKAKSGSLSGLCMLLLAAAILVTWLNRFNVYERIAAMRLSPGIEVNLVPPHLRNGYLPPDQLAIARGKHLVSKHHCLNCHRVTGKSWGRPTFEQIARRYNGDKTYHSVLGQQIMSGTGGRWGSSEWMPSPGREVSQRDASEMAMYILSIR